MTMGQDISPQNDMLRNIGVIAHISAGKTTLSERILFYTNKILHMGEVHEGTTMLDFLPEEQERGITIISTCISCSWGPFTLNLVDTPGHVDFGIEVERCLRVLDGVIAVFCGVRGVEPQSETVWKQSQHFGIPKLTFVNKLDREGADFWKVLKSIEEKLAIIPVPLTIPIGSGREFKGVIDIIHAQALWFESESLGQTVTRTPVPIELLEETAARHAALLVTLAEVDEEFMELYLASTVEKEDIVSAIKRATHALKVTPVFAGAAFKNMGVQPVLDGICTYLPSPLEAQEAEGMDSLTGERHVYPPSAEEPFLALVFKVHSVGGQRFYFLRVYSGTLRKGDAVYNVNKKSTELVEFLGIPDADSTEPVDCVTAGQIAIVKGLRSSTTGDTLAQEESTVVLESIVPHQSVMSQSLQVKDESELENMRTALETMMLDDPSLSAHFSGETGEFIISGLGELHLTVTLARLGRAYDLYPSVGKPQVIFRETVTQEGRSSQIFDKVFGSDRQYGKVAITITPLPRGTGNKVYSHAEGPNVCQEVLFVLEETILNCLDNGILQGFPLCDVQVVVDSIGDEPEQTLTGLRIATTQAVREAFEAAAPVMLEPVMNIEIFSPASMLGASTNILTTIGATIKEILDSSDGKIVHAEAPLQKVFDFSTRLRSCTQGRASLAVHFKQFEPVKG